MDQDVVIQHVTRGLTLLAVVIVSALFATWLMGWLLRRAKAPAGLTAVAQILTPIALLYGISLYLDVAGQVVQARVVSTEEKIAYRAGGGSIPGSWSRSFWATVKFDTPEGERGAPLWLDEATYDALQPASPISVRYLAWLPIIARPADQSTLSFVPWRWLGAGVFILGVFLTLRPLLARVPTLVKAVAALVTVGVLVVWWVFPTPWLPPLAAPILTIDAEVVRVWEETRAFTSGDSTDPAPQPWNLVELRFVPQGRVKAVIAIDGVDVGSVAGLKVGAHLPVSYNAANPREARLTGARTWRWKEWVALAELALWAVVGLAAFLLLRKAVTTWWRGIMRRSER
jgi:hypothetical protein